MCCADWSRDESDLPKYWQYADSQAMNCDWFCEDCPEARASIDLPLLVILIFMSFILCIFVCAFFHRRRNPHHRYM